MGRERKLSRPIALRFLNLFGMRTFLPETVGYCNAFVNFPVRLLQKRRQRDTLLYYGILGRMPAKEQEYGEIQRKEAADRLRGGAGYCCAWCGGVSEDDTGSAAQHGLSLCGHRHHRPGRQPRDHHAAHGAVHGHAGPHQNCYLHHAEQCFHGDAGVRGRREHGHHQCGHPTENFDFAGPVVRLGGCALRAEDQSLHDPGHGGGGVPGGEGCLRPQRLCHR